MAKKKQFAGKKTKLAELPLTRVLEQRAGGEAGGADLQAAAASPRQLILSLEKTAAEAAGLLASTYFQVLQELTRLQADLKPNGASLPATSDSLPQPSLPPPRNLDQALRLAREGLQDLHRMLSE